MLIAGATNNGKTMLVRRFTDANLPVHDEDADAVICPVIYIQMPPTPDARQFYLAILEKLHVPIQRTAVLSHVQAQTLKICKIVGLKVLIIDELHNIHGGRIEQQRYFLNLLRYISNELEIQIIGCGLGHVDKG
jgi:type II secretory pathway predicted ATPase ExeA